MIITKKALPRRTFLRGMGATLALPLLDAMVPSLTALADTPAAPRLRRLGFVYMPMGCDVTRWTPPGEDTLDELSPTLSPLAPVEEHVTVISNLELRNAYPGTHATSNAAFLSAAKAKRTESTDYYLGTTVDQIAAQQIGHDTQLPSLELSMDLLPSSASATTAMPASIRTTCPGRRRRRRCRPRPIRGSCSRSCSAKAAARPTAAPRCSDGPACSTRFARNSPGCRSTLGPGDRTRVDQYLESVREVERRIQQAEADDDRESAAGSRSAGRRSGGLCRPCPADVRPAGAGAAGRHHARHHVPTGARNEQPHVSGDRRVRSASSRSRTTATIPRRSPRWPRSISSTCRCSRSSCRS